MKCSRLLVLTFLSTGTLALNGATIGLEESLVNIDGITDNADPRIDSGGFNSSTGIGTLNVTISTAGPHFVGLFVDHEIDETDNTFFNEVGTKSGSPSPGQSWEIDEPGYVFGDIFDNFSASSSASSFLDNTNGVPPTDPDDVAMALGWNFSLLPSQNADLSFTVGTTAPGGFYLTHTDPESQSSLYFSSRLRISGGGGNTVPDGGGTLVMLLSTVGALVSIASRTKKHRHSHR